MGKRIKREAFPQIIVTRDKYYQRDRIRLTKKLGQSLAKAHGTPLYFYDGEIIRKQVNLMRQCFSWNEGYQCVFPVRLGGNPHLLQTIHGSGCKLLCRNGEELRLAKLAGIPGDDVLYYAFQPEKEERRKALSMGATLILDRGAQLDGLSPEDYGQRVLGLNVSMDNLITVPWQNRGKLRSKLGMSKSELLETANRALAEGFTRFGLYMGNGINSYFPGLMGQATRQILAIADELRQKLGIIPEWCFVGGDMTWNRDEEGKNDPLQEGLPVRNAYAGAALRCAAFGDIPLYTEIGEFILAPAGYLMTRIIDIKELSGRIYLCMDYAAPQLVGATTLGIYYHVSKLGNSTVEGRVTYHVCGRLPEVDDGLKGYTLLPEVRIGDLLAIHDAGLHGWGAFGASCGGEFLPEVLLDGTDCRLISRRERVGDLFVPLQGCENQHE